MSNELKVAFMVACVMLFAILIAVGYGTASMSEKAVACREKCKPHTGLFYSGDCVCDLTKEVMP